MSSDTQNASFHWADYVVFCLMLMSSCAIGIYHGVQDKRKKRNTIEDFLMAGRSMSVLPVSVSLYVSWLSAISFIGDPVEVYYHGINYWFMAVGYCLGLPIVAHFFAPKYKDMHLHSAFEFLEQRFSRYIRLMASIIQGMAAGTFCAISIYVPAICVAQVSGISVWASILTMGFLCIFYTTLGGMKAVLWTDTVQAGIMFVGLLLIVIRGCIVVGGFGRIWSAAQATGHTNIDLTPSPFVRSSAWTYLIGALTGGISPYISVQLFIQRYGTLKTARDAKLAVYLNIPLFVMFTSLFALFGLVMVAYFEGCDPLKSGRVERRDQIVPLIAVELLTVLPGLSGLYLASLFCASLSSMSSYLNSLSLNLLKDIVEPLYLKRHKTPMSTRLALNLSKLFCVILGIMLVLYALLLTQLENLMIFQFAGSLLGLLITPVVAFFTLGMYVSVVGTKGAMTGSLAAIGLLGWWYIGSIVSESAATIELSMTTDNCTWLNRTLNDTDGVTPRRGIWRNSTVTSDNLQLTNVSDSGISILYSLSPLMYGPVEFIITALIAILIGLVTKLFAKKGTVTLQVDTENTEEKDTAEAMF